MQLIDYCREVCHVLHSTSKIANLMQMKTFEPRWYNILYIDFQYTLVLSSTQHTTIQRIQAMPQHLIMLIGFSH